MTQQLYIISLAHDQYETDERVAMQLSGDMWTAMSAHLQYVLGVRGYVHLSTCNRLELYYEHTSDLSDDILVKWSAIAGVNIDTSRATIITDTAGAIDHILDLSLGFKSAVFGDDQIITQLKTSFESARVAGHLSTLLERAYQSMMRCHKRVCNTTEYRTSTVSLAYCTLKRISTSLDSTPNEQKKVLILGAGGMALQVVKYVERFKFGHVDIANRTKSKAERITQGRKISVVDYHGVTQSEYDIIISCTDHGIMQATQMKRPRIYADLSIRSKKDMLDDTTVITLHQMLDELAYHSRNREKATSVVSAIVKHQKSQYLQWVEGWLARQQSAKQQTHEYC